MTPTLLAGAEHFHVIEEPAYAADGSGEHLYVEIEKTGATTEAVGEALAAACGVRRDAVGYAGRKDRHAVTRQWFSIHFGKDDTLAHLPQHLRHGSAVVLAVTRHRNKLRVGHLAGNQFRLGLGGIDAVTLESLRANAARLEHEGIPNAFGPQRFGVAQATLAIACAWGSGDPQAAVARIVDPTGSWHWGDPLPDGFRPGPEGRALGALRRKPDDAVGALRAAGDQLRKLAASAAQSAVFNAILAARQKAGLLHHLRIGDIAATRRGAAFVVTSADHEDANRRCAPGVLDLLTTAPLPGGERLMPSPEVLAEEHAWSAATGVDWAWFARGAPLESPGERRPLLTLFRTAPTFTSEGDVVWMSFALPSGSYATEVLGQLGIAVPSDRR